MERDENFQITLIFLFKERKTQKENQSKGLKTLANEKEERKGSREIRRGFTMSLARLGPHFVRREDPALCGFCVSVAGREEFACQPLI